MLSIDQIPDLVKHVTLAIMAKRPPTYPVKNAIVSMVAGKNNEHFMQCLVMAVNALAAQDYLALGSSVGPGGRLTLTGRGVLLNRQHGLEGAGKSARFNHLYTTALASMHQVAAATESKAQANLDIRNTLRTARSTGARVRGSLTKTSVGKPDPTPKQSKPKTLGTSTKAKVAHAKRAIVKPTSRAPTAKKPMAKRSPVRRSRGRA